MNKEFIPDEQALTLKELGFDKECFAYFFYNGAYSKWVLNVDNKEYEYSNTIKAPTYSQAFKFFREKYGLYHSIGLDNSLENNINCDYQIINHSQSISELETSFKSYEKAELACLIKLIELVKENEKRK
jgi:hypothetical protein